MAGAPRVDPVTAEVIRGAMETVAYEMATHVSLTATTPILNQSNERNATVLDAQGRLAALSVGIPQFMLSSTLPVRFALDFFAAEGGLREGDVVVANDPREPEKVLDDVLDELVSVEGARRDYGVALRGSLADLDLAIDWAETERLRKGRLAPSS
jgi:N-methylhydantoinase B/oxoprolinase/acetone carboxylase alpha subunit